MFFFVVVGLGPGGLDSWDAPMKGVVTLAPIESQTTGPQTNNQPLADASSLFQWETLVV